MWQIEVYDIIHDLWAKANEALAGAKANPFEGEHRLGTHAAVVAKLAAAEARYRRLLNEMEAQTPEVIQ